MPASDRSTWALVLAFAAAVLSGWTAAHAGDRYTATQASHDRARVAVLRARLTLLEGKVGECCGSLEC